MIFFEYLILLIDYLKKLFEDIYYINLLLISLINIIKHFFINFKNYNKIIININQKIIVYISSIMNLEIIIEIILFINIKKM